MKPVNQSLWKRDEDTRLRFLRLMVKGIAHFDAGSIQQHQNAFALARWTSTWTDGSPQLSSQAKQARIKVFADHQLCALRLAGQLANVLGEKLPMTQRLDVSCKSGMKHQLDVMSTKSGPYPHVSFFDLRFWNSDTTLTAVSFLLSKLFAPPSFHFSMIGNVWSNISTSISNVPSTFNSEIYRNSKFQTNPISLAPPPNKGRHRPPNCCREKHAWPVSPLWASALEKRAENEPQRPSKPAMKKGWDPIPKMVST